MNKNQIAAARQLVDRSTNIIIIPSFRVDADSMGAALALKMILEKLGKKPRVISSGATLGRLDFLPGATSVKFTDVYSFDFSKFDLAIFLDGPRLSQFYDQIIHKSPDLKLPPKLNTLLIDHHEPEENFAKTQIIDPQASSVSEMIYEIFADKVRFDARIAENLFAGISGDTGHFRFNSTTPKAMRIAGELFMFGFDLGEVMTGVYYTSPFKVMKFSGKLLGEAVLDQKFRYAFIAVPQEEWQSEGLTLDETSEAILLARDNGLRAIKDVDFVVSLREDSPGRIKGSFRTRVQGKFDLVKLVKLLDPKGGGHKESAGFYINGKSLEEAIKHLAQTISSHYAEIQI